MKKTISILSFLLVVFSCAALNQLTNLPTFYITTQGGASINSKDDYIPGNLSVVSSVLSENLDPVGLEIRGRGNSTWGMAKKPYKIKFSEKRSLLGLPAKAKGWVLLANYADKTMMRNAVAFEAGRFLGMDFTPSVRFVDVVLNGVFIGNYMVTDQIEVDANRVNVEKLDSTDTDDVSITGGYLLEIDGFADAEPVWYQTNKGVKITVKYPDPDNINPQQLGYITNFTNSFEEKLFSSTYADPEIGYRQWVDSASLINWYIACELTGNPDSFWSTNLYKKRNSPKFYFGPLWDYDIAFNNDYRLGDAQNKLMYEYAFENKTWLKQFWTDGWFLTAVNDRWLQLKEAGIIDHLTRYITDLAVQLDASQKKNYEKWNVLGTRVYNEQFLFSTYSGGVDFLKSYLRDRETFLTHSFASAVPQAPSVPFVIDDFYYLVMNNKTMNVIDVTAQSTANNAKLMLWNPVEGRLSQQWKIEMVTPDSYQFINRLSGLAMQSNGHGNNLLQVQPNKFSKYQQWKITPVSTGNLYVLTNNQTGYVADNSNNDATNGTAVLEWDLKTSGAENQRWYLQKVEMLETAIHTVKSAVSFSMYPNPASETLYVTYDGDVLREGAQLEVLSTMGRLMHRTAFTEKEMGVDVRDFPKGLYLLRIVVEGNVYVRKFIKE